MHTEATELRQVLVSRTVRVRDMKFLNNAHHPLCVMCRILGVRYWVLGVRCPDVLQIPLSLVKILIHIL